MTDRNWREYNEALARKGQVLFDPGLLKSWSDELKEMNGGKGEPGTSAPQSSMEFLAVIHAYLLPYGGLRDSCLRAMSAPVGGLEVPDHSTIWWRANMIRLSLTQMLIQMWR